MADIKIYKYSDTNEKVYLEPIIQEGEEGYTTYTYKELKGFTLHVKGKCKIDAGIDRLPMFGGGTLSIFNSELIASYLYVRGNSNVGSSKIKTNICDLTDVIIAKSNLEGKDSALFFNSSIRETEIKATSVEIGRSRLRLCKIKLNDVCMVDGDWTELTISCTEKAKLNIKAKGTTVDGFNFKWDIPAEDGKEHTLVLPDIVGHHEHIEQLSGIYISDITDDPCKISTLKLSHILVNGKVYGYDQIAELIEDLATKE